MIHILNSGQKEKVEGGRNSEGEGVRAGIICVDIVDRDKRVAEEMPEAFC